MLSETCLTQSEQFKFRQINKDSECGTRQNNSELLIISLNSTKAKKRYVCVSCYMEKKIRDDR